MADVSPATRRDPVTEYLREWDERGWEGKEFMAAAATLLRAQQIVMARVTATLRPFDLTQPRFEALLLLYLEPTHELPLARTSERLNVHLTSTIATIDKLAAAGLVVRRQHPGDRRTTYAQLTPAGAALTEKALAAVIADKHGMGALSVEQASQITQALTELRTDASNYEPTVS